MELLILVIKTLLFIFLALILTYCVGRMFGLGFWKSLRGYIKTPNSPEDTTAKGEKKHETK